MRDIALPGVGIVIARRVLCAEAISFAVWRLLRSARNDALTHALNPARISPKNGKAIPFPLKGLCNQRWRAGLSLHDE
jgi:hypothetical protein